VGPPVSDAGPDAAVAPLWVVLEGDDGPLIDEAHRVADLLAETGGRPPVAAVHLSGTDVDPDDVSVQPDEVIRLDRESGEFGLGAGGLAARVAALTWLADDRHPTAVLTGSSPAGDDLVSRLAPRLGGGCATDCLVRVRDGELLAGRAVYEGRAYGEIEFEGGPPVVSVNAAALGSPDARSGKETPTSTHVVPEAALPDPGVETVATKEIPEQDLSRASTIVAGGRGLGGPEGFEVIEELADALGGALGSSRPPADDGWVPYDRQIGVTGKEVDADLYVPCAISGDPYHMRAVAADYLLAINTDPEARIFEFADLGIVGDIYEYGPAIAEAVRAASHQDVDEASATGDVETDGGSPSKDEESSGGGERR
jgi:electron transfer flavoprotein alpha subunit